MNNVASARFCGGVAIAGNPCLICAVQRDSAARMTVGRTPAWLRCHRACCMATSMAQPPAQQEGTGCTASPQFRWPACGTSHSRISNVSVLFVQHCTVQGLTCKWETMSALGMTSFAVCRCCQGTHAAAVHLRARPLSKNFCTQATCFTTDCGAARQDPANLNRRRREGGQEDAQIYKQQGMRKSASVLNCKW